MTTDYDDDDDDDDDDDNDGMSYVYCAYVFMSSQLFVIVQFVVATLGVALKDVLFLSRFIHLAVSKKSVPGT